MARAKATDRLSEEARRVMVQGFAGSRTAAFISQAVKDATGEVVSVRTVSRRAAEWKAKQDQFERAKEQYRAMKEGGLDGAQMLEALAFERLISTPDPFKGADPIEFHGLGLEAKKVAIKEREVAIRERQAAIDERRLKLLEEKEARLRAAVDPEGKKELTPEERLREVRSILGLQEDAA